MRYLEAENDLGAIIGKLRKDRAHYFEDYFFGVFLHFVTMTFLTLVYILEIVVRMKME